MTVALCRSCRANPPTVSGLCSPCWADHLAEAEAQRRDQEKARVAASRPAGAADYGGRSPAGTAMGRGA
jgi:hypothetical protein